MRMQQQHVFCSTGLQITNHALLCSVVKTNIWRMLHVQTTPYHAVKTVKTVKKCVDEKKQIPCDSCFNLMEVRPKVIYLLDVMRMRWNSYF